MKDDDWSDVLNDHPIFTLPKSINGPTGYTKSSLELSTNTLRSFRSVDPQEDGPTPSGRRQVMILKNEDLIVAAGQELRITSLGDAKMGRSTKKSFKVLHTPNIEFDIHQLSLNPNGKLLAVAGACQVAVVVLPRSGYSRLVPTTIDCKSIQVGQFYHASNASAAIAKIGWHPWGEAGSTLMVMTVDGKLREYDISVDPEEPQQTLSFVPEKKTKSYLAEDPTEREVASFSLGRGKADWGPLTMYAVMKSGDIYSICPYMPRNALIPSSYIHALEYYIAQKLSYLSQSPKASISKYQSTLYNYQSLYIKALVNQLPSDIVLGTSSRSVLMHPPTNVQHKVARQGPFLMQPEPRMLEGGEGGDATDIVYLSFGADEDEDDGGLGVDGATERMGVVLVAYQDGRVDVCLDVEKTEAGWETKLKGHDLPMLAVYETIDLGLISMLKEISGPASRPSLLDLLQVNYPVFHVDPIHDETVYVYHAFGVHALHLGSMLQNLAAALRTEDGEELADALQSGIGTNVQPILTTFSVDRRCSNPVIAVAVPNDVYLTYSILILTSAWRICTFPLNLRSDSPPPRTQDILASEESKDSGRFLTPLDGAPPDPSLLSPEPFKPAEILSRPLGLPSNARLAIGSTGSQEEFLLTPESLRYFARTVSTFSNQINEILIANRAAERRADLQIQDFLRQQKMCQHLMELMAKLKGPRFTGALARVENIRQKQKTLAARSDRILQALVEKASPELSEHEKKWFDELKRMKEEVAGVGRYDEGSLAARSKMLEREYERLLPSLKELLKLETERKKKIAESNQELGFSQAFELGERSNNERERISSIEKDIMKLASKLEMTLGQPPSQPKVDNSTQLQISGRS